MAAAAEETALDGGSGDPQQAVLTESKAPTLPDNRPWLFFDLNGVLVEESKNSGRYRERRRLERQQQAEQPGKPPQGQGQGPAEDAAQQPEAAEAAEAEVADAEQQQQQQQQGTPLPADPAEAAAEAADREDERTGGYTRRRNFRARPSIASLLRLRRRFRLGIYTSATIFTVSRALNSMSTSIFHELRGHPEQLQALREETAAFLAQASAVAQPRGLPLVEQPPEGGDPVKEAAEAGGAPEVADRGGAAAVSGTGTDAGRGGGAGVDAGAGAGAGADAGECGGSDVRMTEASSEDRLEKPVDGGGEGPGPDGPAAADGDGGTAAAGGEGARSDEWRRYGGMRGRGRGGWERQGSGRFGGRGDSGFDAGCTWRGRVDARVLFSRILHRDHCLPDPSWQQRPDGKSWDTIKPLAAHGLPLERCLLVDNEARKCAPGEESNLLAVPTWESAADQGVGVWLGLISELLALPEDSDVDVRQHAAVISGRLAALHLPKPAGADDDGYAWELQPQPQPRQYGYGRGNGTEMRPYEQVWGEMQQAPGQRLNSLSKRQRKKAATAAMAVAAAAAALGTDVAVVAASHTGVAADQQRALWAAAAADDSAEVEAFAAESAARAEASQAVVVAAYSKWPAKRRRGDSDGDGGDADGDGEAAAAAGADVGVAAAAAASTDAAVQRLPDPGRQAAILRAIAGHASSGDGSGEQLEHPRSSTHSLQHQSRRPRHQGQQQQLEREPVADPRLDMVLVSCTLAASFATRGSVGHQELVGMLNARRGRHGVGAAWSTDDAVLGALRLGVLRCMPRPSPNMGMRYYTEAQLDPASPAAAALREEEAQQDAAAADPAVTPATGSADPQSVSSWPPCGGGGGGGGGGGSGPDAAPPAPSAAVLRFVRECVLELQQVGGAHAEAVQAVAQDMAPPALHSALADQPLGGLCTQLVNRGVLGAWRWPGAVRYYVRELPDEDQLSEAIRSMVAQEPLYDAERLRMAGTLWSAEAAEASARSFKRRKTEGEGRDSAEGRQGAEGDPEVDGRKGEEEQQRFQAEEAERKQRLEAEAAERTRAEQQRLEAEEAERTRVEQQRLEAEEAERTRVEQQRLEAEEAERTRVEQQRLEAEEAERMRVEEQQKQQKQQQQQQQHEQKESEITRSNHQDAKSREEDRKRRRRQELDLQQEERLRELRQLEWEREQEQMAARAAQRALPPPPSLIALAGGSHKRSRAGEAAAPPGPDPSLPGAVPLYGRPWTWPAQTVFGSPGARGAASRGRGGGTAAPPPPPGRRPLSALHWEVAAFACDSAPQADELAALTGGLAAVQRAATELWPTSRVVLFGSQAAGLALPGSDLDLVVLGVTPNMARAAEGLSGAARSEAAQLLEALARRLKAAGLTRSFQVIKAKVPIVKTVLVPLDANGRPAGHFAGGRQLAADISIGASNGAAAVAMVQRAVAWLPPLRPLCLVIKALLKEAGLNEVFTGGISSYTLVNMIIAHLACEGYDIRRVVQAAESGLAATATATTARGDLGASDRPAKRRRRNSDAEADDVYNEYDGEARGEELYDEGAESDDTDDSDGRGEGDEGSHGGEETDDEESEGSTDDEEPESSTNNEEEEDQEEQQKEEDDWVGGSSSSDDDDDDSGGPGGGGEDSSDVEQDLELYIETGDEDITPRASAGTKAAGASPLQRNCSSPLDWPHAAEAAAYDRDAYDRELAVMAEAAAAIAEAAALINVGGSRSGGGGGAAAAGVAAAAAQPLGLSDVQLSYLRALSRQNTAGGDLGELLHGFLVRFGRMLDPSLEAVSILRGGVTAKLPEWRKRYKGRGRLSGVPGGRPGMLLAVEDPQQRGKDICCGSFNIGVVMGRFAAAAEALARWGMHDGAPEGQRWGAGMGDDQERERAMWAAVQADGSHRSVEGAAAAAAADAPRCQYRILRRILDPDLALGRSDATERARAKHAKKLSKKQRYAPNAKAGAAGASGKKQKGKRGPKGGRPSQPKGQGQGQAQDQPSGSRGGQVPAEQLPAHRQRAREAKARRRAAAREARQREQRLMQEDGQDGDPEAFAQDRVQADGGAGPRRGRLTTRGAKKAARRAAAAAGAAEAGSGAASPRTRANGAMTPGSGGRGGKKRGGDRLGVRAESTKTKPKRKWKRRSTGRGGGSGGGGAGGSGEGFNGARRESSRPHRSKRASVGGGGGGGWGGGGGGGRRGSASTGGGGGGGRGGHGGWVMV